jgi:hypothetical protein
MPVRKLQLHQQGRWHLHHALRSFQIFFIDATARCYVLEVAMTFHQAS